jgi:ABC-type antimicrobial peptide transport system permease subunit
MVLGANRISVFRSILLRGGRQVAVGLVFGVMLAVPSIWTFAHLTRNSPFSFHGLDVSAFGIASALLACVSLAGMYLPALRATQVDPVNSLRVE